MRSGNLYEAEKSGAHDFVDRRCPTQVNFLECKTRIVVERLPLPKCELVPRAEQIGYIRQTSRIKQPSG